MSSPRRPPSSMDLARAPSALSSYSNVLPSQKEEAGPPVATAASVASEFFAKDIAAHENETATAETVVIIHDACYGHRFSRPKTTKSSLSMIVERPERILACALGVSAAYVRLGSRHKGGSYPPHPDRNHGAQPPFKIRKSSRSIGITSPAVVAVHGKKWMEELKFMCDSAGARLSLGMKELARQDDFPPSDTEKPTFHEGDLYLCAESLDALEGALGGVCDAVDQVFAPTADSPKRAFVAIRPPGHHCSSDWPSGFCWINNVHVGIEYAAQTYGLTHAVIFDFDLHHGDGSQDVTWQRNTKSAGMPKSAPFSKKTAIGYYSMHDINSYPCEWGDKEKVQNASLCIDNAHNQSIWNVHLEPWTTMDEFWDLYETKYIVLLDKARAFLKRQTQRIKATPKQVPAKAAIFISAGFDASEWEGAGMQRHAVNVPTEFYARFTSDVIKLAQEEGTAVDGRVISVLEGGYSDRALTSGVLSHLSGLCQSQDGPASNEVVSAVQRMNIVAMGIDKPVEVKSEQASGYNVDWWHISNITALENYITPPPPPPPPTKRTGKLPTYATPTESFTQKVVDPVTFKRTISSTLRAAPVSPPRYVPPPEVNWIVATHELSKLLIPTDRQTKSYKPEDLAPVRAKKERMSGPAAIPVDTGRQLRGRKPKPPEEAPTSAPDMDIITDALRRQTIHDLPGHNSADVPIPSIERPPTRTASRLSQVFSSKSAGQERRSTTPVPARASSRASTREPIQAKARNPRGPTIALKQESRTASPVPRTPTKALANPSSGKVKESAAVASLGSSVTESQSSDRQPVAGPKRIMLKLGTREQSERKTQERLEAEKKQQQQQQQQQQQEERARSRLMKRPSDKAPVRKDVDMAQIHAEPTAPPRLETKVSSNAVKQESASPVPDFTVRQPSPEKIIEPASAVLELQDSALPKQLIDDISTHLASGTYLEDDNRHAVSPPVFTPTSMSQIHTPTENIDIYPSQGRQGFNNGNNNGYIQYEFNPRSTEVDSQSQPSHPDGNSNMENEQGDIRSMIKESMIVHPDMVVSDAVASSSFARPDGSNAGQDDGAAFDPRGWQQHPHGRGVSRDQLPVFSSTGAITFAPTRPASRPAGGEE
ncbi:hypothetical protein AAFC00_002009 [Neodothiora populina]|uniref:Histone deacetylase domain-containing protein n=1 Tax=Neodothiora populina TaxID=2781224 RepID=A0ABR3PFZ0_9PEZI